MKKSQIKIQNISFSFDDKTIITNMNHVLHAGQRVCLLGDNGEWKTTLLQLITKQRYPQKGNINITGEIAYLEQDIPDKTQSAYDYLMSFVQEREEYKIWMALEDAGCEFDSTLSIQQLSWGQQTKLRLAALFLRESSILILDEPTNHLDEDAIERLLSYIQQYEGLVLFVSHDRRFINQIATHCIEIWQGSINYYTGDYESYEQQKQQRYQKELANFTRQERERKKFENWLALMRQRATVYVDPRLGKLIRSRVKMYDRNFVQNKLHKPWNKKKLTLSTSGGTHSWKMLFRTERRSCSFADKQLFRNLSIDARGTQRILLSGPNGVGKSTFLKNIFATYTQQKTIPWIFVGNNLRIAYFSQHDSLKQSDSSVLDWYTQNVKNHGLEHHIVSQLSLVWIDHLQLRKKMHELSYGQRVKLRFIAMTSQDHDLLILDEPTNHLDISTRESLENMLNSYSGAILLVSHDKWFAAAIRTTDIRHIVDKNILQEPML